MMNRLTAAAVAALASFAVLTTTAPGATVPGYQATGTLGMEVTGVGWTTGLGAVSSLSSTFNVTQIPFGAVVQKAFVYSADWNNGGATLDLKLPSSPYLPGSPINSDSAFATLYGYRWDVTPYIMNTPLSYSFTIGLDAGMMPQGSQIYGAALAVVWNDPSAGVSTVSFVDGALQVAENTPTLDSESMTFTGMPAGNTTLHLFTVADDSAGSDEVIKYNSVSVGGPIDENLGNGASVVSISNLTSQSPANNVVSISSSLDHFGWIFSATIVPEPATTTLLALAAPLLAFAAWRRARRRK